MNMYDTEDMCDRHFKEGAYAPVVPAEKKDPDEVVRVEEKNEPEEVVQVEESKEELNNDSRADLSVSE